VCIDDPPLISVLHHDAYCVVVDKPPGMLVHRSRESSDRTFLLQTLRDQIGARINPVHRLDRPASGVLLFATNGEYARFFQEALRQPDAVKRYLVLVRGETATSFSSDRELTSDSGKKQSARTEFERVAEYDGFTLLGARIRTGRRHQIRRHLSHLAHQVVGDTAHGKGRINAWLREEFGLTRLFLHAERLECAHPDGSRLAIECPLAPDLVEFLEKFGSRNE